MGFRIHREGRYIIPISIGIIALILLGIYVLTFNGGLMAVFYAFLALGVIFCGLIVYFFRNPFVAIKERPNGILSPCDGKVVAIEEIFDRVYFNQNVTLVSIFLSPLNVHVNRSPISGTIQFCKYIEGKYLMAIHPKASELNENNYVVCKNDRVTIAYKQIAGLAVRRIICYCKEGDQVNQGEEYGFIKFGSRIDVLIPTSSKVVVSIKQPVRAGITVLAEI